MGGGVTGVSFTIAAADRVPLASGKAVTLGFTIATALSPGDQISLTYPWSFVSSSGALPSVMGSASGLSVQSVQWNFISIRVDGSLAAGAHVVTLSGVTFGPATAGSTTGVTVRPSKELGNPGGPSGLAGGWSTGRVG